MDNSLVLGLYLSAVCASSGGIAISLLTTTIPCNLPSICIDQTQIGIINTLN